MLYNDRPYSMLAAKIDPKRVTHIKRLIEARLKDRLAVPVLVLAKYLKKYKIEEHELAQVSTMMRYDGKLTLDTDFNFALVDNKE